MDKKVCDNCGSGSLILSHTFCTDCKMEMHFEEPVSNGIKNTYILLKNEYKRLSFKKKFLLYFVMLLVFSLLQVPGIILYTLFFIFFASLVTKIALVIMVFIGVLDLIIGTDSTFLAAFLCLIPLFGFRVLLERYPNSENIQIKFSLFKLDGIMNKLYLINSGFKYKSKEEFLKNILKDEIAKVKNYIFCNKNDKNKIIFSEKGWNAFSLAILFNKIESLWAVMPYFNVNEKMEAGGLYPIELAIKNDNYQIAEYLIENNATIPLEILQKEDNIIAKLIEENNDFLRNILRVIDCSNLKIVDILNISLNRAIENEKDLKIIEILLEYNANPLYENSARKTSIDSALQKQNAPILSMLLKYCKDNNLEIDLQNLLDHSITQELNKEIILAILEAGADLLKKAYFDNQSAFEKLIFQDSLYVLSPSLKYIKTSKNYTHCLETPLNTFSIEKYKQLENNTKINLAAAILKSDMNKWINLAKKILSDQISIVSKGSRLIIAGNFYTETIEYGNVEKVLETKSQIAYTKNEMINRFKNERNKNENLSLCRYPLDSEYKYCEYCSSGEITCRHCNGEKEIDCTNPSCKSGIIECNKCNSDGKITKECDQCYGSRIEDCSECMDNQTKNQKLFKCPHHGEDKTCNVCAKEGGVIKKSYVQSRPVPKHPGHMVVEEYVYNMELRKYEKMNEEIEQCSKCNYGKITCKECRGRGEKKYLCDRCKGNKRYACPDCESGKLICEHCEGQGYGECQKCNGVGFEFLNTYQEVYIKETNLSMENPFVFPDNGEFSISDIRVFNDVNKENSIYFDRFIEYKQGGSLINQIVNINDKELGTAIKKYLNNIISLENDNIYSQKFELIPLYVENISVDNYEFIFVNGTLYKYLKLNEKSLAPSL